MELGKYQSNCVRWLLKDKYFFSDLDVNKFLQNSSVETIQGWSLAKALKNSNITKGVLEDVNRVLEGEPVDYVIGYKDFLGCKIDLSLKPLIPRAETEYWVNKVLQELCKKQETINEKQIRVLDIFCGSGCIGVSVLSKLKDIEMTFADISVDCVRQTKNNLKINKIPDSKFQILESNIYTKIAKSFDIIFANPPYVPNRYVQMSKQLYYEPQVALNGGEDGLDIITSFLSQTPEHLNKGGVLYMEFGDNEEKEIKSIIEKSAFKKVSFYKDQFGKYRYLKAKT